MEKKKGFTLMELLVAIAIIGILVAIALPSYKAHIQKANRVAAQLALTKMAQEFERTNARQGAYPIGSAGTTVIAAIDSPDTYTFTPTVSSTVAFTLQATPKGSSVGDECGTMTINQTGATTDENSSADCW